MWITKYFMISLFFKCRLGSWSSKEDSKVYVGPNVCLKSICASYKPGHIHISLSRIKNAVSHVPFELHKNLQPCVSNITVGPTIRSSHRVETRVTSNQKCAMRCHLEAEIMWHARCPLFHRLFRFAASTLSRVHLPTYILSSRTAPCPNSWG